MRSLQEYLNESKGNLQDILCHSGVHIVIGNESCDMDSMVSSIALAYLYHLTKYKNGHVKVIPVMNVMSNEFPVRTQNVYLLNKYGISINSLVCRDNINFEELVANKGLRITLVDHHVLPNGLDILKPYVVDIYDHRPIDETQVWEEQVHKNIQQVGSCATLIAQRFLTTLEKCTCLEKRDIFCLLRDTIIFDTIALNPEAKKVTPPDIEIFGQIEEILGEKAVVKTLYGQLWDAHTDISHLTTFQLMIKDLKSIGDVYIPGLPMLVHSFLKRGDTKHVLQDFYRQKDASLIVLMGIDTSEGIKRDIALYSPEKHHLLLDTIQKNLMKSNMDLEEVHVNVSHIIYFKQNNVSCTRKQVIPIIKECIEIK